jgi:Ca2+-binding RTX toxin-like protein
LSGGGGSDTINGGAGADRMLGGAGNDVYTVDNTGDRVYETTTATGSIDAGGLDTIITSVSVNLSTYTGTAFIERLRLNSTNAINGTGNAADNTIFAGSGNNVIDGGGGIDTASYAYATAGVTVRLNTTATQITGGSGSDALRNIENLTGSNYGDTLTGNGSSNVLTGGAGADRFVFSATLGSRNVDIIKDFVARLDKIVLDDAVFAALPSSTSTLAGINFCASTSGLAADSNDFILYDTDAGALYYDADGTGSIPRMQFATLQGLPALASTDFLIG